MRVEDTIRLLDAGYTKEEIIKMETQGAESAGETETTEPKEPKEQSKADTEHESTVEDNNEIFKELSKSIADLKETVSKMQNDNIKDANGGKPEHKSISECINSFMQEL